MKSPVSIALCTYNGAQFLAEQLDSIAAQTLPPAEIVVNDDRSTDNSVEIVRQFGQKTGLTVNIHVNEKRLGSVQNFATAVARCEGELIALCDQDDVWKPDKLARLSQCFNDERVAVVFSDADLVDVDLRPLGRSLFQSLNFTAKDVMRVNSGEALEVLLRKTVVSGATLMIRADFRGAALPIPALKRKCWDHDGWIALLAAASGAVRVIEQPLSQYRQHARQQIGSVAPSRFDHKRWQRASQFRLDALAGCLHDFERLQERIIHCDLSAKAAEIVSEKAQHMRARLQLPQSFITRLFAVARELFTMRYFRFSSGLSSALGDLLIRGSRKSV